MRFLVVGLVLIAAVLIAPTLLGTEAIIADTVTSTPLPVPTGSPESVIVTEQLVSVSASYYLDSDPDGAAILVKQFEFDAQEVTILVGIKGLDEFAFQFGMLLGKPIEAVYCGYECQMSAATSGDFELRKEWIKNMKLYVLFEDGTYARILLTTPSDAECQILGIYIDSSLMLHAHILDYDGVEKTSLWQIEGNTVTEIEELPYVEDLPFKAYSFSDGVGTSVGYVALISDRNDVAIADPNDKMIDRAYPCITG